MLIGVFKSNQKLINLLVIILTILLWIPSFWSDVNTVAYPISLFNSLDGVTELKIFNFLVSIVLISGQGIYLNFIVNEYKLVSNNTHLTALFFVLMNGISSSLLVFNPIIIVNTFMLIALHQLFRCYNEKQTYALSFNIALLIGIVGLFYFPGVILFPFLWFVLLYTGTPKWRDFVISIIGVLLPFIFFGTYCYLTNELSLLIDSFNITNLLFMESQTESTSFDKYHFYILSIIGLFSGFKLIQTIQRNVIKIRKLKIVVLMMMFLLALTVLLKGNDYIATFLLITPSFSIFLANYFNEIKRNWLGELLFLIIITSMALGYFS